MHKVISRDGTQIAYDLYGSGPLLICVAGATQHRAVDQEGTPALAQLLAPHFTVIIHDRRGRGDSTDTAPYSVQREVDDIAALVAAHGGRASLFGMSSGAVLAAEAAAALGSAITGLVLYEPPIDPSQSALEYEQDRAGMASLAREGRAEEMMADFMGAFMSPEDLAGFQQSPVWPAYAAVGRTLEYDYQILAEARQGDAPPARWSRTTAPTLVLDGDQSFPFMKAGADWVASGLPGAERRTLQGQAHGYAPEVMAPVILEFLRRT
jgi:pimeloyl-ACP methyl ester carboxylesterase